LLQKIEKLRNSCVITFITADQVNSPFFGRMALDVVPFFYEHLQHIGNPDRLDIMIYSQGGDSIVPWRLITLARERCSHLAVLIPYKAHSAATMLALGADEIVMGEMGELSPIDPSIGTPFNPRRDDEPKGAPLEISVEDVAGFFNFARERLHITSEENMIQALQMLVNKLHPLALGSVYRSHALIRMIARNLLSLHMVNSTEEPLINQIVDNIAEKLYYHNYMINRKEAKDLGLKIEFSSHELDETLWTLYKSYKVEMGLGELFDPGQYIGKQAEIEKPLAILDSVGMRSYIRKKLILNPQSVSKPGQQEILIKEHISPWCTEIIQLQENQDEQ
jgi:hypothetical protein